MTLAYISNFFNHHQKPLADEFYNLLGDGNYYFIETAQIPSFRKELGYQKLTAPYVIYYDEETHKLVDSIVNESDVVIFGEAPLGLIKKRYKAGKITFKDSERRYKAINRYLKYPVYTFFSYYYNMGYLLCAGAYVKKDFCLSGMSPKKCFKWGYFPEVKKYDDIEKILAAKGLNENNQTTIVLLWVGRFIGWKHPEIPIKVAKMLSKDGVTFILEMIGAGPLRNKIQSMIKEEGLEDFVHLLGSMPPMEVRKYMEKADIFLITSNRHEGWGAVLNESMNSACAVVANDSIGAVPFLIKDGINGMIYKYGDDIKLYKVIRFLIDNPLKRIQIQKASYLTILNKWNPHIAVCNFLQLVSCLQSKNTNTVQDGPCSNTSINLI